MKLNASQIKKLRSGQTVWKCDVKYVYPGKLEKCKVTEIFFSGAKKLSQDSGNLFSFSLKTTIGNFDLRWLNLEGSCISFSTRKEAIRFKEAIDKQDHAQSFVTELLKDAYDWFIVDTFSDD
jgi:hypothetical protein